MADQKDESKPGGEKGSFELVPGTTVRPGQEGFVVMDPSGKNTLPLRHSLAEHQQAWMKNIQDAIAGTLGPGPEDEAALNAAMKNMQTNATEGRERTDTAVGKAKVVSCYKGWGFLGLTVKNGPRGAGVVVTKLEPGSQLEACGLNVGDTILSIGKIMVNDHGGTIKAIEETAPDQTLVLTMASPTVKVRVDKTKGDLGLSLRDNPSGTGVTVCGIADNSVAGPAGVEIDHEIIAVNGVEVNDHATAVKVMNEAARWVDMVVVGENNTTHGARALTVPMEPGAPEQLQCEPMAGMGPSTPGVTVTAVAEGSAAAKAGVAVGDTIYAINNIPVPRAPAPAAHQSTCENNRAAPCSSHTPPP